MAKALPKRDALWALAAETLEDFLSRAEMAAIEEIKPLCNPLKHSGFWEGLVARILAGETTRHGCPWDVEVEGVRVEVKFATAFDCAFSNGTRRVFKFASLTGAGEGRKDCDVMVLVGFDDPSIYAWVIPFAEVKSSNATISTPGSRRTEAGGSSRAFFDAYGSCMSQLLPDVMSAAYRLPETPADRHMRLGQADLFQSDLLPREDPKP